MRLIVPLQGVFQGRGGLLLGILVPCSLYYTLQLLRGFWHGNSSPSDQKKKQQQHNLEAPDEACSKISKRGMAILEGGDSSYYLGWKEYERNAYHPIKNPHGCIQLGLAESTLSLDLLQDWIEANPSALELNLEEIAGYPNYAGLEIFRKALANFMGDALGGKLEFDPENMVVTSGATAVVDILSFCLAEPGSAFLVPSPYYPGFTRDTCWRNNVELIPVPSFSGRSFNITAAALNASFEKAKKQGKIVKGVLVSSPCNPVGNTLDVQTLKVLLKFVNDKGIHLICDEIYGGSTFTDPEFVSVAKVIESGGYDSSNIHIIYGMSKDLGLPGFRVGVLYSWNKQVISIATRLGRFGSVSTQTQCLLAGLLGDKQFMSEFLRENKRRIKRRWQWMVSGLKDCGIQYVKGNAGVFCWIDMRHLMKDQSQDGETGLWKRLLFEAGLSLTPGSACHCPEPGWFRLCFANQSEEVLSIALKRLKKFGGRK